jgi:UDP-3-O-[3-hydroxymyristoyl] glucosamine N-acyltransferase
VAVLTLEQLAAQLGGELCGNPTYPIDGLAPLATATSSQLAFLANARYQSQLDHTQAGAVLLRAADAVGFAGQALIVADPYACFARLSHVFDQTPKPAAGIHASAVIDPSATIDATASIGPFVVVEAGAVIGARTVLASGVQVSEAAQIGADCWLGAHVVIHHRCVLGDRVRIHAGASIGADGFGFAPQGGRWHRIAQIGRVCIGNDVRIGANTTIDRGALDDTIIHDGVIIDNQVQIAHNVVIGAHTAIAACCGISGSTRIGQHCVLAGGVGLVGHIEICDHVHLTGMTMVTKSITQAGSYSSGTAMTDTPQWKKMAVRLRQLADVPINRLPDQLGHMQARLERLESLLLDDQPAAVPPSLDG